LPIGYARQVSAAAWARKFFMDKMKKVKKKREMAKNLTLPHWDLNPRFLKKTFLPKILILREIRSIELRVL
jgi:hypothetical protein